MPKNIRKQHINEQGNAMIYVLIALALFGFLTVTLSRQNDQADGQDLSDEQAALYANELIEYSTSAQYAIEMMLSSGSEVNDLDFINPGSAAFDVGSHIHKVYHPQGGGLNYHAKFNEEIAVDSASGWYLINSANIEWTPTTGNDVVLSALRISKSICENINKKITGSTAIPPLSVGLISIFGPDSHSTDLDATSCVNCDGYPALCVVETSGTYYGFYSIIAAQ